MTPASSYFRLYTQFTLALFEDSGYYIPNYELAEPIYWGKGEGCEFISENC